RRAPPHSPRGRSSEARPRPDQLPAATPPSTAGPPPAADADTAPAQDRRRRPRGQQRGHPGHGRRDHSQLPATEELLALPADQQRRSQLRQPLADFPATAGTTPHP